MKANSICTIEGCSSVVASRGWCNKHYHRWYNHGDPLYCSIAYSVEERFAKYTQQVGECTEWTGAISDNGYGKITVSGKGNSHYAHRVAWELAGNTLTKGLVIDHICHNRRCVNVSHLREVGYKQNLENMKALRSDNTSGYRGVTKCGKKWVAGVHHNSTRIYCGIFATAEEAAEAARLKRLELFTHNDADRQVTSKPLRKRYND